MIRGQTTEKLSLQLRWWWTDLGCPPWGKGLISSLMLLGSGKTLRGALGLFLTLGVCLGKGLWNSGFIHAVSLPGMDYAPLFCSVLCAP